MSRPMPAGEATLSNLQQVGRFLDQLSTPASPGEQQAKVGVAQVYATAALVHAVRELTEVVREAVDGGR